MKPRRVLYKPCDHCGTVFPYTQGNTRWCGPKCRKAARYTDNHNEYKGKGIHNLSGKMCEMPTCTNDRGPNFKICQTCVIRTRGSDEPTINLTGVDTREGV